MSDYDYDEDEDFPSDTPAVEVGDDRIMVSVSKDSLRNILNSAALHVSASLKKSAEKMIAAKVDELWRDALRDACEAKAREFLEDFLNNPRPKTNSYGEKVGGSVTLSEIITKEWGDYLNQKVRLKGGGEAGYRDPDVTRGEYIIRTMGISHIQDAAKTAVDEIGKEARQRVQEAVVAFVTEQMAPRLEIRPPGDKEPF